MEKFLKWTFDLVLDKNSPAVASLKNGMGADKGMFLLPIWEQGAQSWTWPSMPRSKQKLVELNKFDPTQEFSKRGAHMPLMIYIGEKNQTRRSQKAMRARAEAADKRGWNAERRQAFPAGKGKQAKGFSTSGGGEAAGSQAKGNGAKANEGYGTGQHEWSATAAWPWWTKAGWDSSTTAAWKWSTTEWNWDSR